MAPLLSDYLDSLSGTFYPAQRSSSRLVVWDRVGIREGRDGIEVEESLSWWWREKRDVMVSGEEGGYHDGGEREGMS